MLGKIRAAKCNAQAAILSITRAATGGHLGKEGGAIIDQAIHTIDLMCWLGYGENGCNLDYADVNMPIATI